MRDGRDREARGAAKPVPGQPIRGSLDGHGLVVATMVKDLASSALPRLDGAPAPSARRPLRVLFFGEGSTLAHAARPLALSAALPSDRYEVFLATPERYRNWTPKAVRWLPLEAQPPEVFAERLKSGRPLFSHERLQAYAAQDLVTIEDVGPDVVVGDFRLSLAASARKAGVPYISISNAYWSPDRPLRPIRPTVDMFGGWPTPAAAAAFQLLRPLTLRWHAKPVDELLAAHGLERIGRDLRRAFTEADITLYADLPGLFPDVVETARRRFLGPIAWEPPVELPPWWRNMPVDKPIAYVTLGSSGEIGTLERITAWLLDMGHAVMLATAGRARVEGDGERLFVADFLPGLLACERADLVVCNGGSPTTTQALLKGRPVLGVASNMDQFLNIRAVRALGAGAGLRADGLNRRRFEDTVNRLSGFKAARAAAALALQGQTQAPHRVLIEAIESLVG
jgi:UDP:flavonoid glycosyltransferase YjiC (YdhE family)